MTPDRWQKVQEAYLDVTVLEPAARPGFIEATCRGDAEMRREIESLLACENKIGKFLEQTAIEALVAEYGSDVTHDGRLGEPDFVGALIDDRYIVRRHIGSGGGGDVYEAVHRLLETPVAIKRLGRDLRNVEAHRRRFIQEARKAVLLDHENIAKVKDVVEQADEVFVVMEYIQGETLRARSNHPVPLDEFFDIAGQCADAIAAAHRERIVHLDLKPENIMITPSGKVKICDFGIARQLSAEGSPDANDAVWALAGTPAYMAPEVVRSSEFDAGADIFSLGVVFYEMLTGEHPFRADTVKGTLNRILEEPMPPAALANRKVPRRLSHLIERMLAKQPAARPSADEVTHELRSFRGAPARPWSVAAVVLSLVIAVAPLAFAPDFFKSLVGSPSAPRMLAVLPFTNVSGDSVNQALCDGLVETLSARLSQFERFQNAFRVLPATELRGERVATARQAKQIFGAAFVVTGSVQRLAEGRVRLTVNLVDTATLAQDPISMDQDLLNLSSLQDAVVIKVAQLLNGKLPQAAEVAFERSTPADRSAYEPYVEGRGRLQTYQNVADVDAAIDFFAASLKIDSRYAAAHAALGEAYWRKYELSKDPQFADLARQSCDTAMKIDDRLASVYVTSALIANGTGRHPEAITAARRALGINPFDAGAYMELARAYQAQSKVLDAESVYQQAIAARPNDWSPHNDLGSFYYKQARYSEAAAEFRLVLQLAPDNVRGLSNLSAAYQQLKRYSDAGVILKRALEIHPTPAAYSNLGTIYYYHLHDPMAAARMFVQAAALDARNYKWWRNAGSAYASAGEKDKAKAAYEKAIEVAEHERETNPRSQPLLIALADCYAMTGQPGRALDHVRQAMDVASPDANQMVAVGEVYEEVGQRALAIEWIGRALRGGFSRDLIESSPSLAKLRSDPAFEALTKR